MEQQKSIWAEAQEVYYFSESLRIAKDPVWAQAEYAKATSMLNTAKKLLPNIPDFIPMSFRDFMNASIGLYWDRHIAPQLYGKSGRTVAQVDLFYEPNPEDGGYATPFSNLMED